jgi:nucleotide-binding universal stress UspA family protein
MKLLIGYDGSECAGDAILDLFNAGLPSNDVDATVLSIADLLPGMPGQEFVSDYPTALNQARFHVQEAIDLAKRLSAEGAERLRQLFPGWTVHADATADSPYWGLVKRAEKLNADLLVVGSHGRTRLGRWMLGSVSHNVVLYAHCSTRVGRCRKGSATRDATPVKIIVGWDGSHNAAYAVRAAASRSWPQGSQARVVTALDIRLVTALSLAVPPQPFQEVAAGPMPPVTQDPNDGLLDGARAATEQLRAANLEVLDPLLREGDPKRVLVDEAKSWEADCIFVGARGLSRMERVLLGSVSGAVAERAGCAVEVIRPPQVQAPTRVDSGAGGV